MLIRWIECRHARTLWRPPRKWLSSCIHGTSPWGRRPIRWHHAGTHSRTHRSPPTHVTASSRKWPSSAHHRPRPTSKVIMCPLRHSSSHSRSYWRWRSTPKHIWWRRWRPSAWRSTASQRARSTGWKGWTRTSSAAPMETTGGWASGHRIVRRTPCTAVDDSRIVRSPSWATLISWKSPLHNSNCNRNLSQNSDGCLFCCFLCVFSGEICLRFPSPVQVLVLLPFSQRNIL